MENLWLIGLVVLVFGLLAAFFVVRQRAAPPPAPAPEVRKPVAAAPAASQFSDRLAMLHQAGQWPELLRLLDRTLPEWVVSASLIVAVRELASREEAIPRARANGASEEVTGRMSRQAAEVAADLWAMANRITAADQMGVRQARELMERQDDVLLRLTEGIRASRDGLAELSLGGIDNVQSLSGAERRFRALAATARELQEWEREQVPW